ncbi:MAG TPA: hypothetical protein VKB80_26085 [Kofleriaceae bacterium]|nr:hypothetical protein [Kofleriaceae bacterium]
MKKKTQRVQSVVDDLLGGLPRGGRRTGGVARGLAGRELAFEHLKGVTGGYIPLGTTTRCTDQWGEYNDDSDKNDEGPILA